MGTDKQRPVLVIDDEYYVTRAISFLLKEEGLPCITKNDGNGVIEVLDETNPLLVLLDINMPHPDGFAICKEIRSHAKHKDTKIIFLSARGQDSDVAKGKELGAEDYILKPFNPIELLNKVKTIYGMETT